MNLGEPRLFKSYRHMWQVPDKVAGDFAMDGPRFAWAAFGPRGAQAGVEKTAGEADTRSRYAEGLLAGGES